MASTSNTCRTNIATLQQTLANFGLQANSTRREVLVSKIFCHQNGLQEPNYTDGPLYTRRVIQSMKEEIHERISGSGLSIAVEVLKGLITVKNKDALLVICLLLDGENITALPLPARTNLPRSLHGVQLIRQMKDIVRAGQLSTTSPPTQTPLQSRTICRRTFHRFPKLPIEIRQMVWKTSIQSGRVVEVYKYKGWMKTICRPPIPLHVNKESRTFARQQYHQVPGLQYFHPNFDTLLLGRRSQLYIENLPKEIPQWFRHQTVAAIIKHLGVLVGAFTPFETTTKYLTHFLNLESITCVSSDTLHLDPHETVLVPDISFRRLPGVVKKLFVREDVNEAVRKVVPEVVMAEAVYFSAA